MNKHSLFDLTPSRFLPRWRWAVVAASALSACSFAPDYKRPDMSVENMWPVTSSAARIVETTIVPEMLWQDFVLDANLREVIALSLANNRDLRAAAFNIEQARAQYQIRRADQLPTVGLSATGLRQPASDGSGAVASVYTAGLALPVWEVDFFGRLSNLKEAAVAQFMATDEARKSVQISLIASVANTWLSLQVNDELLALTQTTLRTRDESLKLVTLRHRYGAASELDLRLAESQAAAARAVFSQQQRLRALDVNALTLLVGATPSPQFLVTVKPAGASTDRPHLFKPLPVGLPSEVLIRRPDIQQAEWQLKAANANIGAARAAYWPRITLTASGGAVSGDLGNLFKNGTSAFTLAPQAFLPIFDFGRNEAATDSAHAAKAAAIAQYEKSIQVAFREVSDALVALSTLNEQLSAQQAQVFAEGERAKLTELRFANGIGSSLDVLDAQRSLLAAQQALSQLKLAQWQNQVALYKTLGGGWTDTIAAK
jgi:outer membrane protein, multidrug efflux system